MASAAFDVALATILVYWIDTNSPLFAWLSILAALLLLPAIVQFWQTIKYWLSYKIFLKNRIVRYYTTTFSKSDFPDSSTFLEGRDYLASIVDDANEPLTSKLSASMLLGELTAAKQIAPFSLGLERVIWILNRRRDSLEGLDLIQAVCWVEAGMHDQTLFQ